MIFLTERGSSRHSPRPALARAVEPAPGTATSWTPIPTTWRNWPGASTSTTRFIAARGLLRFNAGMLSDRSQFFQHAIIPFFGGNRNGAKVSQDERGTFWLIGMQGGLKCLYDCTPLRLHQGALGDGFHGGPQGVRCSNAHPAQRRRADRPDRRVRTQSRRPDSERTTVNLLWCIARDVRDREEPRQRGFVRPHQGMSSRHGPGGNRIDA